MSGATHPPDDVRSLSRAALDALREVANIGAGHAATALSQITGQRIMISVPELMIVPLEEVPNHVAPADEPVAAVAIKVDGDITGLTMLVFPTPIAHRVAGLMMGRPVTVMGAIEESALKEAGNILSAAYLNALAEFLGMRILNSPPELAIDMSEAVLSSTYVEMAHGGSHVFCVESDFQLLGDAAPLRGFFLLLPDPASLRAILTAIRIA